VTELVSPDQLSPLDIEVRDFGSANGDPANHIVRSVCTDCQSSTFWMQVSEEDGVALHVCTSCKLSSFIGDSAELWEDADTGDATCPCGKKVFQIAVGYCLDPQGDVTWMIVGAQCEACSELGIYADWCIDYEPNKHLLTLN
jgi:hypothetical protein